MKVRLKRIGKDITYALEKAGVKLADRIVKDAIAYGEKKAKDLYENASYDGTLNDINVYVTKNKAGHYTLTAEGPQVKAIERGSGDFSESRTVGPRVLFSKTTGKAFWFYKTPAGNVYRATGKPKRVFQRRYKKSLTDPKQGFYRSRQEARASWGKEWDEAQKDRLLRQSLAQDYRSKSHFVNVHEREHRIYITKYINDKPRSGNKRADVVRYDSEDGTVKSGLKESTKYSATFGNEPQHVMEKTKDLIIEHIQGKK